MSLEERIILKLIQRKLTLSTAESCTGGLVAHRLTNVPGSSEVFHLGLVLYSNASKHALVHVSQRILDEFGAVSKSVAIAMARGVKKILKSDYAIAITGIAGPGGGSKAKPVGLTFIALSTPSGTPAVKYLFKGTRQEIKSQAATEALRLLWNSLNE